MLMHCRVSALLSLGVLPALASAQPPDLKLPSFADLQHEAVDTVNITIGPAMLRFAGWVIDDHDPESAAVRKTLRGLRSVQVHSFRFKTDHVYGASDLEALRSQLSAPGWYQLVKVRDHGTDDVDIYYALDDHSITGLAILAAKPREFTLVNIVGTIDLDQIAALRHTFVPGEDGAPKPAATVPEEQTAPQPAPTEP